MLRVWCTSCCRCLHIVKPLLQTNVFNIKCVMYKCWILNLIRPRQFLLSSFLWTTYSIQIALILYRNKIAITGMFCFKCLTKNVHLSNTFSSIHPCIHHHSHDYQHHQAKHSFQNQLKHWKLSCMQKNNTQNKHITNDIFILKKKRGKFHRNRTFKMSSYRASH